ncbi:MAG: uroporphyrinogen-III synthase [Colwellia sp.]
MQNLSANTPLNVLITRPEKKGLSLASYLNKEGVKSHCQPLFDYQPLSNTEQAKVALNSCDIAIFVSVAAVNFAQQHTSLSLCSIKHVIAVGKATEKALQDQDVKNVIHPECENSEGILSLPLFIQDLTNKNITIVRGNSGRELLATELTKRGANVNYLAVYKKQWRLVENDTVKSWQEQQINCIVVTSNELLQRLADAMLSLENSRTKEQIAYWQQQCTWCVASERIASLAKKLSIENILVCDGASNKAIGDALQQKWKAQ